MFMWNLSFMKYILIGVFRGNFIFSKQEIIGNSIYNSGWWIAFITRIEFKIQFKCIQSRIYIGYWNWTMDWICTTTNLLHTTELLFYKVIFYKIFPNSKFIRSFRWQLHFVIEPWYFILFWPLTSMSKLFQLTKSILLMNYFEILNVHLKYCTAHVYYSVIF